MVEQRDVRYSSALIVRGAQGGAAGWCRVVQGECTALAYENESEEIKYSVIEGEEIKYSVIEGEEIKYSVIEGEEMKYSVIEGEEIKY